MHPCAKIPKRHLDIQTSYAYKASMKMLTLRMDEGLHRALKIKCVIEGVEMNAVVNKLIEDHVKGNTPKPKSKK
jgi:predicted HicB family RNase H-like nuclease